MPRHRNKIVEGAVPCGNPKRYGSRDVVHMPQFGSHDKQHKSSHEGGGDGAATESEKHLQALLHQQLKRDISLTEQFSQHRSFSLATSHDPEVEKLVGVCRLDKYRDVDTLDARIDFLRHCGLDDGEITLKLTEEFKDKLLDSAPITGYGVDPESRQEKLREIEEKIREKEKMFTVPDTTRGALVLGRQAMEVEKLKIWSQGREPTPTGLVTMVKKYENTHPDDPANHIREMLSEIEGKKEREPRRDRRRKRKLERKKLYYEKFGNDFNASSSAFVSGNECGPMLKPNDNNLGHSSSSEHDDSPSPNPEAGNFSHACPTFKTFMKDSEEFITNHQVMSTKTDECRSNNGDSCEKYPRFLCPASNQDPVSEYKNSSFVANSAIGHRDQNLNDKAPVTGSTSTLAPAHVHLLSEDEIVRNRLSMQEICAMDKFHNYTEGEPNKIVYIKNLPSKTTEEDLVALFGRFHSQGQPKLIFRLMSGKMKGQAFITFPDETTAGRAIKLVNGFKLHDRPIILSYGRRQRP